LRKDFRSDVGALSRELNYFQAGAAVGGVLVELLSFNQMLALRFIVLLLTFIFS
jgi:hypothetical protein